MLVKSGSAKGKGPCQKKRQQKKNDTKDKEKKKKGKNCANKADDDSDNKSHSSHTTYLASLSQITFSSYQWLLDSVATTHICKFKLAFINLKMKPGTIGGINKKAVTLSILGRGDIHIISKVDGWNDEIITLHNVAYCPDAVGNLISEGQLDWKGMEICWKNGKVTIWKPDGTTVMQGRLEGLLYHLMSPLHRTPNILLNSHSLLTIQSLSIYGIGD